MVVSTFPPPNEKSLSFALKIPAGAGEATSSPIGSVAIVLCPRSSRTIELAILCQRSVQRSRETARDILELLAQISGILACHLLERLDESLGNATGSLKQALQQALSKRPWKKRTRHVHMAVRRGGRTRKRWTQSLRTKLRGGKVRFCYRQGPEGRIRGDPNRDEQAHKKQTPDHDPHKATRIGGAKNTRPEQDQQHS